MEKTLTIRDLRISFQASGGTVRAVRGVDLDLYQGKRSPSWASPAPAKA